MSLYLILKSLHETCALLTICGFLLRGYWMLQDSPLLKQKAVKIVPHVIDTLLLLSAIGLLAVLGFELIRQAWLIHKITLLVVYILLGMIALGDKYSKPIKVAAFVGAVVVFAYIVGIAVSKSPMSWSVYLL